MNSVEQLLKQKLQKAVKLQEQYIASNLIKDSPNTASTTKNQKKLNKQQSVQKLQQRISDLQAKSNTSKDPTAMKAQLDLLKKKLSLDQAEVSQMQ